ncbi:MmcQ/YjbR family DNA-binding protein [Nocardioides convexus]|uniref:MmcQ/YjbR family DNA-binding protein n=1 Tax=Nocardioides convexus TaxID=2712224 RepID=UPI0024189D9B|nr:MmcQ/YjbR family DNA-binding protein [Nocardioides convexus]
MARTTRPDVPGEYVARLRALFGRLPECREEDAWVGVRWRVAGTTATVAHVFGGEDQAVPHHLPGRAGRGDGLPAPRSAVLPGGVGRQRRRPAPRRRHRLGGDSASLLTDSFCLQAPQRLVDRVDRP